MFNEKGGCSFIDPIFRLLVPVIRSAGAENQMFLDWTPQM